MLQSITTTYHGPTNTRGSRIGATSASGERASVEYDDALGTFENHKQAALKLAKRFGWFGTWQGGSSVKGCVFVLMTDKHDRFIIDRSEVA